MKPGDMVQLRVGAWDFAGDIYQPPGGLVRRYGLYYDKPYEVLETSSGRLGKHIYIKNDDGVRCGGLAADRFEYYDGD